MKDVLLAKVAVSAANFSIDKPYTYQIPETFAQQVTVGMRVLVPFGRGNRHTEGLVLALEQQEALPPRCKRILTALDDRPVLNQEGIQLALWMRERYFCSVYEAMRAMLPAGLYFSLKDRYVIPDGVTPAAAYAAARSVPAEAAGAGCAVRPWQSYGAVRAVPSHGHRLAGRCPAGSW